MESIEKNEKINVIDVKIFPYRFLKPKTAEKILNKIYELKGNIRVVVHGPSLPKKVGFGPAKGLDVNHKDRTHINIQGTQVNLKLNVGEIIVTVDLSEFNKFMEELELILNEYMPCEYIGMIGIFTKTTATTSDYMKYGEGFESLIDKRFIGMVDPNARSSETIEIINE